MKIFDLIHFRIIFILICVFGQLSSADIPKITCNDARAGKVEDAKPILAREAQYPERADQFKTKMRTYPTYIETNVPENRFCPIPLSSIYGPAQQKTIVVGITALDTTSYNMGANAEIVFPFDPNTKKQWNLGNGESIQNCKRNSDCRKLDDDRYQGYCEYAVQPSVNFYVDKNVFNPVTSTHSEKRAHKFCYKMKKLEAATLIALPDKTGLLRCTTREQCDDEVYGANMFLLWDCVEVFGPGSATVCVMKYQTSGLILAPPAPTMIDGDINKVLLPYALDSTSLISKNKILTTADTCQNNAQCGHLTTTLDFGYCMQSLNSGKYRNSKGKYGINATFCYKMTPAKLETYLIDLMEKGPKTCDFKADGRGHTCPTGYNCRIMELKHANTTNQRACARDVTLSPEFYRHKKAFDSGPYSKNTPRTLLTSDSVAGQDCSKNSECTFKDDFGQESGFCSPSIRSGQRSDDGGEKQKLCFKLVNEPKTRYDILAEGLGPPNCTTNSDCKSPDSYCRLSKAYSLSAFAFCVFDKCMFGKIIEQDTLGYVWKKSGVGKKLYCPIPYPSSIRKEDAELISRTIDDKTRLVSEKFLSISFPFDAKTKEQWNFDDGHKISFCTKNSDCSSLDDDKHQGYCQYAADPEKIGTPKEDGTLQQMDKAVIQKYCYKMRRAEFQYVLIPEELGLISCKDRSVCDDHSKNPFMIWDCQTPIDLNMTSSFCTRRLQTTGLFPTVDTQGLTPSDADQVLLPYEKTSPTLIPKNRILVETDTCYSNEDCKHLTKLGVYGYCHASKLNQVYKNKDDIAGKVATFCYALIPFNNERIIIPDLRRGPEKCADKCAKDGHFCRDALIKYIKVPGLRLCAEDVHLVPQFFTAPFQSGPYANRRRIMLLTRNEISDNVCSKNKQCFFLGSTSGFCSSATHSLTNIEESGWKLCYKLEEEPNAEYLLLPDDLGAVTCMENDNDRCKSAEYSTHTSDVPVCKLSSVYSQRNFCLRVRPRTALFDKVGKMDATPDAISTIIFPYDKYYSQQLPNAPNDSYICTKNEDCLLFSNETSEFTGYCYPSIDPSKPAQTPNDAFKLCYKLVSGKKEFVVPKDNVGPTQCDENDNCAAGQKCEIMDIDSSIKDAKKTKLCVKTGDYCSDEKWEAVVTHIEVNEKGYQYKDKSVVSTPGNVYCGVPYSSEFNYPDIVTLNEQTHAGTNPSRDGPFGEVTYPYETLFKTRWTFKTKYWQFRTCTKNSECSFLDGNEYIGYCKKSWDPTFTTSKNMVESDAFCYKMQKIIDPYIFHPDNQGLIACTDDASCRNHTEDINKEWRCGEVNITKGTVTLVKSFCTNSALRPALFHGVTFYNITSKMMQESLQALVANRKHEFVPYRPTREMECDTNKDCDIHTNENYTAYCYNTTHHSASNESFSVKRDEKFCFRLANVPYTYYDVYPEEVGPTQCTKNQECHSLGKYGEDGVYWYCKKLAQYEEPRMKDVRVCARSKWCPGISYSMPHKHSCKLNKECYVDGIEGMCYPAVEEEQPNMCCEYHKKKCANGGYPSLPIRTCQTHDDCPDDRVKDDDNRWEYTLLNLTEQEAKEKPNRKWCDTSQNLCCDGVRADDGFAETYCEDGATIIQQQPLCAYYKKENRTSGVCLQDMDNRTTVLGGNCTLGHCCPSIHVPVYWGAYMYIPPPPDIAGYAGLTNTSCIMVRPPENSTLPIYYRVPNRYKFAYCHEKTKKVVLIGRVDISGFIMGRTTQNCTSNHDCRDKMCVREYKSVSVCYKFLPPKWPLRFYMILHFILVYWAWQFYWEYRDYVPIAVLNEWCYNNRFIPDLEKVAEDFDDITWFDEEEDVLGRHAHSMAYEFESYQFYRDRPYNASFVHMPFGPQYICCAAPLSEEQLEEGLHRGFTTEEFINLVVSSNTEVIVMFGDWYEFGQTRSAEYLPLPEEEVVRFKIFKAETDVEYKSYPYCYPMAIAAITDPLGDPDGHEFWHFTYPGWIEEETPRDVQKLFGIKELIELPEFENTQILLHCRRGVLQSASFLAMLYFAQRCTVNPRLDMISLMREFRYQRPGTINTTYDWYYLYHGACAMMVEMGAIQSEGMLDVPFYVWQRNQFSWFSEDDIDRHQDNWHMCDFSGSLLEFEEEQYKEIGAISDWKNRFEIYRKRFDYNKYDKKYDTDE